MATEKREDRMCKSSASDAAITFKEGNKVFSDLIILWTDISQHETELLFSLTVSDFICDNNEVDGILDSLNNLLHNCFLEWDQLAQTAPHYKILCARKDQMWLRTSRSQVPTAHVQLVT